MKEFSRGLHAKVYPLTQAQKLYFPSADLARVEPLHPYETVNEVKKLYYKHKIAFLLFPDAFIDVVAMHSGEEEGELQSVLYSRLASVPERHAVFAAHMEYEVGQKFASKNCNDCLRHNKFHRWRRLESKAEKAAEPILRAGIEPPIGDPSDYCLATTGKGIIFFEIERFYPKDVANYIARNASANTVQAMMLLERYRALG